MESSKSDRTCNTISRRSFLGGTALVVLPILCGGCATDKTVMVDLPSVVNNSIVIPLDAFPELGGVGGSILGRIAGRADPIIIARVDESTFAAVDALCTHQQCTVAYNALGRTFDCPCHNSSYEIDGRLIGGPAPRPLRSYSAQSDGTSLTITLA
jgi:cytochrome b6-f complex iron-sulfur subunit